MAPGDTTDTPELFVDIISGRPYSGHKNWPHSMLDTRYSQNGEWLIGEW